MDNRPVKHTEYGSGVCVSGRECENEWVCVFVCSSIFHRHSYCLIEDVWVFFCITVYWQSCSTITHCGANLFLIPWTLANSITVWVLLLYVFVCMLVRLCVCVKDRPILKFCLVPKVLSTTADSLVSPPAFKCTWSEGLMLHTAPLA